ncbi:MAG: SGNH/GDSL hydrolase family protein [Spirochaetales bacterium]|nr:SGNH/GDSL hydrolase family protein [Spirochaetales bacterium]
MPKNILFRLPAVIGLVFSLAACVTAQPAPVQQAQTPKAPEQVAAPLDYDAMIARSLLSTGNNVRLKAAIDRAKAGKDVNIAFIGGSITEGTGAAGYAKSFAPLVGEAFKTLYGNGAVLNAGMAGTPSSLGAIRYRRDIVQRLDGANPDVVFIEFAVNDGDDKTSGAAYESMVRDILAAKNKPAVVLLFCVFRTQWNMQDRYIPVGQAYGLPMISIKDAVVPELRSKAIPANEFFADEYHPTSYGHRIMADCIMNLFKTDDAAPADAKDVSMPVKPVIGKQYQGIQMVDSAHTPKGVTVKPGGFTANDPAVWSYMYPPRAKAFPDNWHKTDADSNEPFTMTLVCKNLMLVTKSSASFGTAEVSVDGKLVKSVNGRDGGGWNNAVTDVLFDNAKAARHVVTIKMTDNSAAKRFTILAFGFTK